MSFKHPGHTLPLNILDFSLYFFLLLPPTLESNFPPSEIIHAGNPNSAPIHYFALDFIYIFNGQTNFATHQVGTLPLRCHIWSNFHH